MARKRTSSKAVAAKVHRRMQDETRGRQLVEALKVSPHRSLDLQPDRRAMPVRSVKL